MASSLFDPASTSTVALATLAPPTTAGIASRTLLKTTGGKVVHFAFDAGQELTEHTNPNHAVLQVLTGSLHLTLGGEPEQVRPGHLVHLPPQLPHAVRADEPCTFLLTLLAP
jgi:quercetin dioxygenase-like cupin family protein